MWLEGRGGRGLVRVVGGGAGCWLQDGYTALQRAAYHGHIEVVRELLGKKADVSMVDKVNKLAFLD